MIRQGFSWLIMAVLGVTIIIIGIEGSLGRMLGCILTPGSIQVGGQ